MKLQLCTTLVRPHVEVLCAVLDASPQEGGGRTGVSTATFPVLEDANHGERLHRLGMFSPKQIRLLKELQSFLNKQLWRTLFSIAKGNI